MSASTPAERAALKKSGRRVRLLAGGQGIAHEIDADAVFMREGDRAGKRVRPEGGRGAHVEPPEPR